MSVGGTHLRTGFTCLLDSAALLLGLLTCDIHSPLSVGGTHLNRGFTCLLDSKSVERRRHPPVEALLATQTNCMQLGSAAEARRFKLQALLLGSAAGVRRFNRQALQLGSAAGVRRFKLQALLLGSAAGVRRFKRQAQLVQTTRGFKLQALLLASADSQSLERRRHLPAHARTYMYTTTNTYKCTLSFCLLSLSLSLSD